MVLAVKVLVNGVGNIGTTMLQVLAAHRKTLGISAIYAHRATLRPWETAQVRRLEAHGVVVLAPEHSELDPLDTVTNEIEYVFDTTRQGGGLRNRCLYEKLPSLLGASAQGSESGFGTPFMLGFDIPVQDSPFVHIVSCNTHGALAVLLALSGGDLDQVEDADFVVARRSDDIANHERLVAGNVISRHLDPALGTHHGIDADALLRSVGRVLPIQTSDITTPSQFLHASRFSVKMNEQISLPEVAERIENNPYVGTTAIFDSNKVFEIGRRFGLAGRLFNQAVFVPNNLLVKGTTVTGWTFVPQEGNTILSTLAAFLRRTRPVDEATQALETVARSLLIRRL